MFGGVRDSNGLLRIIYRHHGNHIGGGVGECADLVRVIELGLIFRHFVARNIAVAARADAACDHDGNSVIQAADFLQQLNRPAVGPKGLRGEAKSCAPVRARPPSGALQYQAGIAAFGYISVGLMIPPQSRFAFRTSEQGEGGEVGQLQSSWKTIVVSRPPSVRNSPP